ncbi:hypothetical protein [Nocardia veterana]|uniref:Uncharacterized protein n=1 Tax=Nocardia veterana TaxID=132249 RepID=A0A7X6LYM0_9NOCA|nr:hypothetical protein [Nocardia veterana]NKY87030.1 hypothetical protein [Nocardia veterana]
MSFTMLAAAWVAGSGSLSTRVVLGVIRRNRYLMTGIRVAMAAVPMALALGFAGAAGAVGPVQPGVTTPDAPAQSDEPAELRSATPQQAPAPRSAPHSAPKPEQPKEQPPAPREVRIGEFSAPVPEVVPDAVVDGVNRATEGLEGALAPNAEHK